MGVVIVIKPKVYSLNSTDPYLNLAIEDYLFRGVKSDEYLLLFYSNRPSVVIGHFQDPWKECNIKLMNETNISLVRRQSGGGAVFHDELSINFCFMASDKNFNQQLHNQIFEKLFSSLGVSFSIEENNSYYVNSYKCSGSAFKNIKGRKLHHGTLLLDGDIHLIKELLSSKNSFLKSKSTDSKIAKIKTLRDWQISLNKKEWIEKISNLFYSSFTVSKENETLSENKIKDEQKVLGEAKRLSSSEWIYGVTPLSEFCSSEIGLCFKIKKGYLEEVRYSADNSILWSGKIHVSRLEREEHLREMVNKKALSFDKALSEIISFKL